MLGSSLLHEEGDGAEEELSANLPLLLAKCPAGGVTDGSVLTVEDFTQKLTVWTGRLLSDKSDCYVLVFLVTGENIGEACSF